MNLTNRHDIIKAFSLDGTFNPCTECVVDTVCDEVCDKLRIAVGNNQIFSHDFSENENKDPIERYGIPEIEVKK